MIARVWHGITPASAAGAYADYIARTGVTECLATKGNCGVFVLRRLQDANAEFLFLSLWESLEAIRRFAGAEIERAVYYPEDRDFLLGLEPRVVHWDVVEPRADDRSGHLRRMIRPLG